MSSSMDKLLTLDKTLTLKLKSSDSEIFTVEEAVALRCSTIKNIVEDGCASGEIPLLNVDGKTLSMVLEWCKKHSNDTIAENELKRWKSEFMNMNSDELYDLIMASNYLDEKDLLNECCDKVAEWIKGKNPDQIREKLGIKNDFTSEEQAQIDKQYGWAFK